MDDNRIKRNTKPPTHLHTCLPIHPNLQSCVVQDVPAAALLQIKRKLVFPFSADTVTSAVYVRKDKRGWPGVGDGKLYIKSLWSNIDPSATGRLKLY